METLEGVCQDIVGHSPAQGLAVNAGGTVVDAAKDTRIPDLELGA